MDSIYEKLHINWTGKMKHTILAFDNWFTWKDGKVSWINSTGLIQYQ